MSGGGWTGSVARVAPYDGEFRFGDDAADVLAVRGTKDWDEIRLTFPGAPWASGVIKRDAAGYLATLDIATCRVEFRGRAVGERIEFVETSYAIHPAYRFPSEEAAA